MVFCEDTQQIVHRHVDRPISKDRPLLELPIELGRLTLLLSFW